MPMELKISISLQINMRKLSLLYYALRLSYYKAILHHVDSCHRIHTRAHLARLLRGGAVPEEEQNQSQADDSREREDHEVQHLDSLHQLHSPARMKGGSKAKV